MKTSSDQSPLVPWALYLGLALTTASMLLVQQFLTRIFSVLFNSGLAFLAISTTFLGLGSAGVAVYVLPRWFARERGSAQVPVLAFAYSITLVASFAALIALEQVSQRLWPSASMLAQVRNVSLAALIMLPAMLLVGLVIVLVLRAHAERVNRLYAADLVGGGAGCLLVLPLMEWIGGDQGIFCIGALAALGASALAHAHGVRSMRTAALIAALVFMALPWFNRQQELVNVRSHDTGMASARNWVLEDREIGRVWNSLSRLGIFETRDGSALYVRIDSSCQTSLPSQDPKFTQAFVSSTDFVRLPYVLERHASYLEIGAGGGRGMQLARAMGSQRILGVEINPGITSRSMDGFPGYGVGPWTRTDPSVELRTAEGRSFARATGERFDTVTITFIQTGVASGSAAFALSEANLFTVEAFEEFLSLLNDDGVFYVYRQNGNEMLRLISMAREALASFGIDDLRAHLYVAGNEVGHSVILVGRSPFTPEEVARMDAAAGELGIQIIYSPSGAPGPRPPNPLLDRIAELRARGGLDMGAASALYRDLMHDPSYEMIEATYIRSRDPAAFQRGALVDVSAPTDDRPYFFFTGLTDWRDLRLYFDLAGVRILGGTVILLFWMAVAFALLVVALILLPLLVRRSGAGTGTRGLAAVLYFSGLGVGYIAVQISFIQRFTLFLGHPVYAISVVLLAFLLSSGLGSLSSDRLFRPGRLGFASALLLLAGLLVTYDFFLPLLFRSSALSAPVAVKLALTLLLILPLAFVMGLFFPQGIRLLNRVAPELTPWAWAANSAASILGSIFSLILAIHFGFSITALTAAAIYFVLCYPASVVLQRHARLAGR